MNNPVENKRAVDSLLVSIKDHPMCGRFEELVGYYQVIYPHGNFKVHGVRASIGGGKLKALQRMLLAMESEWYNSYPKNN